MDRPNTSASIDIAAPADVVYDLVSDVTTVPDCAAEIDRCSWTRGATGPAVGARFRGGNRRDWRRWSTTCEVTDAEPGRTFAFQVRAAGPRSAQWRYDIEPSDGGCRVTESAWRQFPKPIASVMNRVLLDVKDRDAHNQANIDASLAGLKARAERSPRRDHDTTRQAPARRSRWAVIGVALGVALGLAALTLAHRRAREE